MRSNIAKKMMAVTLATSTLSTFAPSITFAKEAQYTISENDESEMTEVLKNVFSKKVGNMQYKKTENKTDQKTKAEQSVTTYESAKYRIEVVGLDVNKSGDQEVTMYLTSKKASDKNSEGVVLSNEALQANNESTIVAADTGITVKHETVVNVNQQQSNSQTAPEQSQQAQVQSTSTDFHQKIADAALAQVGVYQDCTMLASNSLAAVGINFHGWPEDYLSLGELTSEPVPGDIIVYSGHVAVYVGNGQAVHGGWLGNQTVVSSVECTNALIGFVHVTQA
jgi:hypothetical protein